MPALSSSKSSDLEFDSLQPCFYPDEDDFYYCGPDSAPFGEDIWKKFELLPTPPLSPSRAALPGEAEARELCYSPPGGFGLGDPLDWDPSELLLEDTDIWGASDGDLFGSVSVETNSANGIILQDCMWSGFSAREKLERVVNEKLVARGGATAVSSVSSTGTGGACGGVSSKSASVVGKTPLELNRSISECVDAAVVFPFPVNKRSSGCLLARSQPGVRVPSPSGTGSADDTPSDSDDEDDDDTDDDDDEDDEEEEEEIDVVTVEKRRGGSKVAVANGSLTVRSSSGSAAAATGSGVSRAPQELILKRSAAVHQQQHNYAAPYDDPTDLHTHTHAPPGKRHRPDTHSPRSAAKTSSSSPASPSSSVTGVTTTTSSQPRPRKNNGSGDLGATSDTDSPSEDSERRRNHNILERQRRNDLRSSFLTLRDAVPELARNERAAKVVILKRAAEYVGRLEGEELRLRRDRDRLQARRQQLLRRLEQAKTR